MRAIWKGVILLGDVRVPVKLHSAVKDRKIRFRLLHAEDRVPVEQRMVHPVTGDPVEHGEARRGLAMNDGSYVILAVEELAAVEPPPSRDIRITRCLPIGVMAHQYYDRPYYLGPDGDAGAYAALASAFAAEQKEGLAHWVMRKKEYTGALRARGGHLMLITLRHAEEIISPAELPAPTGRALEEREERMAEQLVGMLADRFEPAAYRVEHRERLQALIEAKARGGEIELPKYPRRRVEEALDRALVESLKNARRQRKVA